MTFLGLTTEEWELFRSVATVFTAGIAIIALSITYFTLKANSRTLQLRVLWDIFQEIRALDREYMETDFGLWPDTKQTAWSTTFFNTVEYLCFIVNHKMARAKELKKFFFDQALPSWKKMFDDHVNRKILRDDSTMFIEFKKAHRHLIGQ